MKAGDEVRIRKNGAIGVIGEISGDIVYVDLNTGVEMELFLNDIVLESKYVTPRLERERERGQEVEDKVWIAASQGILDLLKDPIINLGKWSHQSASKAVSILGGSATDWDDLDAHQKMNFITVATGIPVKRWIESCNNDELARLQLTALAMFAEQMKG